MSESSQHLRVGTVVTMDNTAPRLTLVPSSEPQAQGRTCRVCKAVESAAIPFRKGKNLCKACQKQYGAEYHRTHKTQWGVYQRAAHEKSKCNSEKFLLSYIKGTARKFNIPFNLTESDIFIPDFCPILGIRLRKPGTGPGDDVASIDRLIPSLGYVKGNINIISMRANRIKSDATLEELERLAAWMRSQL